MKTFFSDLFKCSIQKFDFNCLANLLIEKLLLLALAYLILTNLLRTRFVKNILEHCKPYFNKIRKFMIRVSDSIITYRDDQDPYFRKVWELISKFLDSILTYGTVSLILALLTVRYGFGCSGFITSFIGEFISYLQNINHEHILFITIPALVFIIFIIIKLYVKFKYVRLFILFFLIFFSFKLVVDGNFQSFTSSLFKPANSGSGFDLINIFQLIAIILLVSLLYIFFRWLSSSNGIIIQPFDDLSLKSKNEEENLRNGRAVADLLAAELHRINHIHNLIEDGKLKIQTSSSLLSVCRENLELRLIKGENLEGTFADAGTISIHDKGTLQIGSILLAIRQLWPWGKVQVITGSIRKYGSKLKMAVRYEQCNHQYDIHAYETQRELKNSKESPDIILTDMVKDIAYRITLDSSQKSLSTRSWEAFKFFTEAISHLYCHERTQSLTHLNRAYYLCLSANKKDKNYKKIGDLLSIIGFCYLNRDEQNKANDALTKALEINPKSPYAQALHGNIHYLQCEYDKALEHYRYARALEPSCPEFYIKIGMVYTIKFQEYVETYNSLPREAKTFKNKAYQCFRTALFIDSNNHAAQSALTWLDFLCYFKKTRIDQTSWITCNNSLEKALNRLNNMSPDKITYIDYSNKALLLLYKEVQNEDDTEKAYDNWWKALQICPSNQKFSTFSDKLHHIFYELIIAESDEVVAQIFDDLEHFLSNRLVLYTRAIKDLLGDARFIFKCIDSIEIKSTKINLSRLKISMARFIQILNFLIEFNAFMNQFIQTFATLVTLGLKSQD